MFLLSSQGVLLPVEICLDGAVSRLGHERYDIPWIDTELDPKFKEEIINFPSKNLPQIYSILEKYSDRSEEHTSELQSR